MIIFRHINNKWQLFTYNYISILDKLHLQFEMDYGYLTSIREKSLTFRRKKKQF